MILVTGGFGSIGAHTLALADFGEEVVVTWHRKAALGRNADAAAADPYLDTSRLARDTGFEPAFDVRAGVADYVAWLQNNPS